MSNYVEKSNILSALGRFLANCKNLFANKDDLEDIADGTTVVGKAAADEDGNNIKTTYATKASVDNIVDGTTVVKKAEEDEDGNNIKTTYATASSVADIVDGTTVVGKADSDEDGNNIKTTYETKTDAEAVKEKIGPLDFSEKYDNSSVNLFGVNVLNIVGVPASASASGKAGDASFDPNYFYICVATNTWKKIALSNV